MQSDKSKENRRGRNRRRSGRKDEKREVERLKNPRNEESWLHYSVVDPEDQVDIVEQEIPLNLENSDNGNENNATPSFMCPALRRQLQTHKNILQLLHEHKLASTQINGQRILSIQPTRWTGPTPGIECEIFVGRIPKTIYEDTLYPLFKLVGEIFQLRLMVDMAEMTRGYCFIMYTNQEDAARAIAHLDQYEILPDRKIRVLASVNKCKLYVGPLPWYVASEEVVRVIYASAWDIEYVSIYRFPNHDAAYAIVSFKTHRNAALARRKLRPERLFKCNDVHVEWARIDWNPSNVYEDRGTVNDKGDVQISRKYLQAKKTAASFSPPMAPTPNNFNRGQKQQLPPICPPDSNNRNRTSKIVRGCNGTRYSTMLTMSAALDDCSLLDATCNAKSEAIKDINDNVQQQPDEYGGVLKDTTNCKKDDAIVDADSFRSFDMWNSNLVSQLPNSPTSPPGSLEDYDSPSKTPNKSSYDWESNTEYSSPKTTASLGEHQRLRDADIPDYYYPYNNYSINETADRNRLIVADTVRYQAATAAATASQQNHSVAPPYYVLLRSQDYFYPQEDATASYPQPPPAAIVNCIHDDCRSSSSSSRWCGNNGQAAIGFNGRVGSMASDPKTIASSSYASGKPPGDWKFRCAEISPKLAEYDGVGAAPLMLPPVVNNVTSNHVQNYPPQNFMMNVTPMYASLVPARNSSESVVASPHFVSFNVQTAISDDDRSRRPRAILKRAIARVQQ